MNGNTPEIYQFSNGIRIERANLLELQIERYSAPWNPNLHEPVEKEWMERLIERMGTESTTFLDVGRAWDERFSKSANITYFLMIRPRRCNRMASLSPADSRN